MDGWIDIEIEIEKETELYIDMCIYIYRERCRYIEREIETEIEIEIEIEIEKEIEIEIEIEIELEIDPLTDLVADSSWLAPWSMAQPCLACNDRSRRGGLGPRPAVTLPKAGRGGERGTTISRLFSIYVR